ncbi:calcium-binding protein [Agromyces italicus]|uniref:calcium-binding protein n=1 Tax=Agromyces italicus TaxID=279572 RepID=UPI0003B790B5|nr:calcium-binding protein [Agromyces italicus]
MRAQNYPNPLSTTPFAHRHALERIAVGVIAVVAAWALALAGAVPAQAVDPAVDEPAAVERFRENLGTVATDVIAEYSTFGAMTKPLALEDDRLIPSSIVTPASALALGHAMSKLQSDIAADAHTAATLDQFVGQLDTDYDGPVDESVPALDGITFDLEASSLPTSAGAEGFNLSITVEHTVKVPITVVDPTLQGGIANQATPLRLTAADAPYRVRFTFEADYRVDTAADRFWVAPVDDGPAALLETDLAGDDAFVFPSGEAAVGIADVEILDGSTVDVDARWSSGLADSNSDGQLSLSEPAADGGPRVPGELAVPVAQLSDFTHDGTATASIKFGSTLLGLSSSPAPTAVLDADLATDDPLVAHFTGTDSDLDALEMACRLGPGDLVSGLVQYGNLVRTMQLAPGADRELPLAGGRLSDLVNLGDPYFTLAEELITVDPSKELGQQIVIHVSTVGELAAELATLDGVGDAPTVTFDRAAETMRIGLAAHRSFADATTTTLNLPDDSSVAQFSSGDQLRGTTGLRGVAHEGAARDPDVRTGFDLDLPITIDLREAQPASDDPGTPAIEDQSPMPYERFGAEVGDGAELSFTQSATAPIAARGSIGFVPAKVGGEYKLVPDGSEPTGSVDVSAVGGATSTPQMQALAQAITKPGTDYDVDTADAAGKLQAKLSVSAPGVNADGTWQDVSPTSPALTDDPGTYDVAGEAFANPAGAALSFAATNGNRPAGLLKSLDLDPEAVVTDALRGRTIDGIAQAVGEVASAASTEIPVLGLSAGEILDRLVGIDELLDGLRDPASAGDVRALERAVEGKLPAGARLDLRLRDLEAGTASGLDVKLAFEKTAEQQLPLALDGDGKSMGAVTGIPKATLHGEMKLGVMIPLTKAASAPKMLGDSSAAFSAKLDTPDDGTLKFGVTAGPFSASLGDGHAGYLELGARFAVTDATQTDDSPVDFGAWSPTAVLSSTQDDPFSCPVPGEAAVTGEFGCIAMPVMVGAVGISSLATPPTADDFVTGSFGSGGADIGLPAGLLDSIDTSDFSFDSLSDGLAAISKIIDAAIAASSAGSGLPGIGEDLGKFAKGLSDAKAFIAKPVPGLNGSDVDALLFEANGLRDQLFANFGPVLIDSDYPAVAGFETTTGDAPGTTDVNARDIRIVPICTGGVVCAPGALPTDLEDVTVEMELGQGNPDVSDCTNAADCIDGEPVDLGFGLDGLPLKLDAKAIAKAGWRLELGFGLSRDDGFYLIDNPVPADVDVTQWADDDAAGTPQELRVHASVELKDDPGTPGNEGRVTGVVGFLGMTATAIDGEKTGIEAGVQLGLKVDDGQTCTLGADYRSGISDAYCWKRLKLTQLLSGGLTDVLGEPRVDGSANAHLTIDTGVAKPGFEAVNDSLPTITADFTLEWSFDNSGVGDPTIALEHIRVNPGELFQRLFGGVLKALDPVLQPIKPVRDFLFSPIPVLTDLSELFGGDPVTVASLAEQFGDVDLSLLRDIDLLLDFVEKAQASANGQPIEILEKLQISGDAAQGPPRTSDQADELIKPNTLPSKEADEAKGAQLATDMKSTLGSDVTGYDKVTDPADSDFTFEMFDKPSCLATLLIGKDCGIAEWQPDPLTIRMPYEASFGPFFGVLYITIAGEVNASAQFGAGISTRGVRLMGEQIVKAGGLPSDMVAAIGDTFLQSLYLADVDGEGKDIPEFTVSGSIKAGAKLSIVIASFKVEGGITATFGLNLNDTPQADGRMYFDEIWPKILNPVCLFDFQGSLKASLDASVQVGWPPLGWEDSWNLAEITLLDFSSSCSDKPAEPKLAIEQPNGVLKLNVGPGNTRGVKSGEPNEIYEVRQTTEHPDTTDHKYTFVITAFGATETKRGTSIELYSGNGNDSFTFLGGGAAGEKGSLKDYEKPTEGDPGVPAPTGSWAFTAPVSGNLGVGADKYRGGDGPDVMNGEENCPASGDATADADVIDLGAGANRACGGPGNDNITGGPGTDILDGDGDGDTIDGGLGEDTVSGGAGVDHLFGGTEPVDKAKAGSGTLTVDGDDLIIGGLDADTIQGSSGADKVYGDALYGTVTNPDTNVANGARNEGDAGGVDTIEGGPGADFLFGGGGNDVVYGGMRIPDQDADTSADHIQGDAGDDELHGGAGGDDLWGGRSGDRAFGGPGVDKIDGQADNDPELRGGPDDDKVWGGAGNDSLFGDEGLDNLVGDGRADAGTAPTPGDDRADGGAGDDMVLGDNGTISGVVTHAGGIAIDARVAHPSALSTKVDDAAPIGNDPGLGGGDGDDKVYGEGGDDTGTGGAGRDLLHGNADVDHLYGETGDDEAWGDVGNDVVQGGPDEDVLYGNADSDTVDGQEGVDLVIGGHYGLTGKDTGDRLTGGTERDRLYGDDVSITPGMTGITSDSDVSFSPSADSSTYGRDTGDGGPGQDELHGQDEVDTLYGAGDYDQVFGELAGDFLVGGPGPDDLVGDQGTMSPEARHVQPPAGGWAPGTPKGSPEVTIELVAPTVGGDDLIWGDFDTADAPWSTGGDDRGFGGHGTDTLRGGAYDDHLEGNGGQDRIFGFDEESDHTADDSTDGADDLIGGSSPVNPLAKPDGFNHALDEGELEMEGNDLDDVMTGDNAVLTRHADPDDPNAWQTDPVTGGVFREVTLLDTEKTGADLDEVSGGDYMRGNHENDRMFGEGGNDRVKGDADDDLVEGDQDGDWLEGNADEDDVIGGSSFPDQPDSGDVLWGGGGADVLAGDNACIVRDVPGVDFEPASCPALDDPALDEFHYVTSQLGVETRRGLVYHDLDGPFPSEFGRDILNGGSGVDAEFGQDGGDALFGDGGADFQHGNGDTDIIVGDRPVDTYGEIALPPEVGGTLPTLPAEPTGLPGSPSTGAFLVGPAQADGQDDQFGGSNLAGHRDTGDWLFGDGEADFQLGDNGELIRTVEGEEDDASYAVYEERYPDNDPPDDGSAVIEREVTRYDVGVPAAAGVWGADLVFGGNGTNPLISAGAGDGDDSQWGQDGDDRLFGEDGADDQFGELGDDTMWGGAGEDAMVGDRGGVQTRFVETDGSDAGDPDILTHTSQGPPGINLGGPDAGAQDAVLHPFEAHPLYRGTSLSHDRDGSVLVKNGHDAGGADRMRGGPGHDSMHGGEGADLMNGDSGGDYAYGDDGADVMWGGRGDPMVGSPDLPGRNAPGANGEWLDVLFAGYGANATEAGADVIDYQPRPGVDPASWFTMVQAYADTAPEGAGTAGRAETRQHHHGTDWQYGGWDRDVLQADVSANGPNDGDKLLDWGGAYNLYTACNAAYGGWNDVRKIDPNNLAGLEKLAYVTGARADFDGAPTLGDVQANGSAAREAAIVYTKDLKNNTGKAFSGTPGHFEDFICASD